MERERLFELAAGDVTDLSREMGLLEAYAHRRCMAWFQRRRDGIAGAATAHQLWLDFEDELRALRKIYLPRARGVAEGFVDESPVDIQETGGTSGEHMPPLSAA